MLRQKAVLPTAGHGRSAGQRRADGPEVGRVEDAVDVGRLGQVVTVDVPPAEHELAVGHELVVGAVGEGQPLVADQSELEQLDAGDDGRRHRAAQSDDRDSDSAFHVSSSIVSAGHDTPAATGQET